MPGAHVRDKIGRSFWNVVFLDEPTDLDSMRFQILSDATNICLPSWSTWLSSMPKEWYKDMFTIARHVRWLLRVNKGCKMSGNKRKGVGRTTALRKESRYRGVRHLEVGVRTSWPAWVKGCERSHVGICFADHERQTRPTSRNIKDTSLPSRHVLNKGVDLPRGCKEPRCALRNIREK